MSTTYHDIMKIIEASGKPVTAAGLAAALPMSKSMVNSLLYRMENKMVRKVLGSHPAGGARAGLPL